MPALLEIKDLSLCLRGNEKQVLLEGVSFQLNKGRVLGIVGESGSGKSLTALSIISLLPENIRIFRGEVLFHEDDKTTSLLLLGNKEIRRYRGRKIGMIFQEPMTSLNPSMRCGRQIEEGIRAHSKTGKTVLRKKVLNLLKEVQFPYPEEICHKYPHQLSGGQRQRLMIAIALCSDPEIIIADEPTTALDVTVQKNIIDLLLNLRKQRNLSVIFISHDLRLISRIADDILVMRKGKVIEAGPVNRIFHHPETTYSKALIACQPPLNHRPARLMTIQDIENGNEIHVSIPGTQIPFVSPDQQPLLSIRNLVVHYSIPGGMFTGGGKKLMAVSRVSFDVYKAETLGLVGESGCGKTTIGKAILKLIRFNEGEIYYKGINTKLLNYKELSMFRKNVQVVFQDPFSSLNPKYTVLKMLDESVRFHFPGLDHQKRIERITGLLIKVGLSESDLYKYPHQFSGGQRQRISIARALSTEPEFLILDESVSSLDVSVQAQVLNLLNDLKDSLGLTYIFISHDLAVVNYMATRVVVMYEGRIEETGKPDQIFKSPSSRYTRTLIESIPGYQNSI